MMTVEDVIEALQRMPKHAPVRMIRTFVAHESIADGGTWAEENVERIAFEGDRVVID